MRRCPYHHRHRPTLRVAVESNPLHVGNGTWKPVLLRIRFPSSGLGKPGCSESNGMAWASQAMGKTDALCMSDSWCSRIVRFLNITSDSVLASQESIAM